jgi:cellulose synthase/poly-beta-1,6-N-acetylglucosamine synthase-like glycosyltransferase
MFVTASRIIATLVRRHRRLPAFAACLIAAYLALAACPSYAAQADGTAAVAAASRAEPFVYDGHVGRVIEYKPVSEWAILGGATGWFPRVSSAPLQVIFVTMMVITLLLIIYTIRHYTFAFDRLFGRQNHSFVHIDEADWPRVTVFVAAHNEEAVIADCLEALLRVDYPPDRIRLMPVNDRSTDRTQEIIDGFVARFPGRITPFHRTGGKPGKAAALKDATELVDSEIVVVFDADYVPGKGLIKQLVSPFFDPETGATMGRVVPINTHANLLTRLLDLERAGGYQVDQQARMAMGLVPQYGGTVGGVRLAALREVGGWNDDALAEDTELTYRLLVAGWKTVYQNQAECYEEVPETWPVRVRQLKRWAKGHNQVSWRYVRPLLRTRQVNFSQRLDGLLLLGVYHMCFLLLFGWTLAVILLYATPDEWLFGPLLLYALMAFGTMGNFAVFFEISVAIHLDGSRNRMRLLPLNLFSFLINMMAISAASWDLFLDWWFKRGLKWDKTVRSRQSTQLAPLDGGAPDPTHDPHDPRPPS